MIKTKSRNHFKPINSRSWDTIHHYFINNLVKNQVSAVFHSRVIRRTVSPKFIELCMQTPCLCPSEGQQTSLLWKELLNITFNPNFVALYASVAHDPLSILWAFLTNSVSCSSTRFHLPKAWSTLAAFFTYDIWSWCTWLRFKFVAMAAGAGLACLPSRGVFRVGPFFAWHAKRCLILLAEGWKSRRTLFTRQDRGSGIDFDQRL